MADRKRALVIGASGFLGSHLVRELVKQDYQVRILVRKTSNISHLGDIVVEQCIGDVMDPTSLRDAMADCDYVFHSAVNTSAWLIDSGPLYETNVVGVINAVNAARYSKIERFVLTSSIATIGKSSQGLSDENCHLTNNDRLAPYVRTRELAEKLTLQAFQEEGFPGIACCVANTYGGQDVQPTPHGDLIRRVAKGGMPFYFKTHSECVGIRNAAKALILAAEKGRPGERYIISDRYLSQRDLFAMAARQAGVKVPRFAFPNWLLYSLIVPIEAVCRLLGLESRLSRRSVSLLLNTWPMSHQKAVDELGWQPGPLEDEIKEAVDFYLQRDTEKQ